MTHIDRLVQLCRPVFIQGFHGPYDRIAPIGTGEPIPDPKPTVYYSVRDFPDCFGILYCVFHPWDWTHRGGLPGIWDQHKYDFEGTLRIVDKDTGIGIWNICVCHNELKFYRTVSPEILIEPEGHGHYMKAELPGKRNLIYADYNLVDIEEPKFHKWMFGPLRKEFNKHGVNVPDRWGDEFLERRYGGLKSKGYIYSDPSSLIALALKAGRIKKKQMNQEVEKYATL